MRQEQREGPEGREAKKELGGSAADPAPAAPSPDKLGLRCHLCQPSAQACKTRVVMPILQMQKLRLREEQMLLRRPHLQVAEPGMNLGLCGPVPRLPLPGMQS